MDKIALRKFVSSMRCRAGFTRECRKPRWRLTCSVKAPDYSWPEAWLTSPPQWGTSCPGWTSRPCWSAGRAGSRRWRAWWQWSSTSSPSPPLLPSVPPPGRVVWAGGRWGRDRRRWWSSTTRLEHIDGMGPATQHARLGLPPLLLIFPCSIKTQHFLLQRTFPAKKLSRAEARKYVFCSATAASKSIFITWISGHVRSLRPSPTAMAPLRKVGPRFKVRLENLRWGRNCL